MNSTRHIVVVDTETNGLDPRRHQAVEVAWWNLTTNERGMFIPTHNVSEVLANADVKALQINRYVDRIADQVPSVDSHERGKFAQQLDGCTLAGSNPAFDAAMVEKLLRPRHTLQINGKPVTTWRQPWHHRMLDLSNYAAGMLALNDLPGLAKVCELLDVDPGDHTAEADVTATGECFNKLFARAASERELTVAELS
ncbi:MULTISPECIES: 3'-5' exonuclease [Pseudonocardia]|uniref:Exonuclease n=2 Tax=Pseudonocardia TaxID=1847 RepID=A0A1Y2MLF5_PSEAH|nr:MULTISPECIES: exonuclease domain-containing protein [Pseudonocardia]OSY36080.1 Exonuclease [Pseudonocardia autotrophica]TDN77561.1 DNA polymerase III epsilon subunit-like protein [Pseudonocardia autotrophica]BBG01591.1 hypothetical protein Pdca_28000 [Pseudonocardia autotrophica]GEC25336.1 hypothetical protein PSA01_23650 [Pseudonocardia saturnea]